MAKKKRSKKRKGTSVREEQPNQEVAMSSTSKDEAASEEQEGHTSDGGMSSDLLEESEGTHTEMTSIMSSESLVEALEPDESDDGGEGHEGHSVYAASQYPRASESHRTEMPYYTNLPIYDTDMSSTRSFMERELDYQYENGRRYCGTYHLPNDEWEQCRMSVIHRVYLHVFEHNLSTVTLDKPTRILDVGTGIGEWAIGMADTWTDCEVIGTDISAIAPTSVPANCFFEVDDAELEWEREPDSFDLVHLRNMMGSFTDWNFIYKEAYKVLKPGGWLELLDFDDQAGFLKFLAQFPPESDMHILARDLAIASVKSGRPRGIAHLNPVLLIDAGFVDIKLAEHIIPINVDASGGKLWLIACIDGLEAACLRPLTKYMGWDPDKVKTSCYAVAKEMARIAKDPVKSKGLNIKVRVLVGRKPMDPEGSNAQNFNEDTEMREDETNEEDHSKLPNGNGIVPDVSTSDNEGTDMGMDLVSDEDLSTVHTGNRSIQDVQSEEAMPDLESTGIRAELESDEDRSMLQNGDGDHRDTESRGPESGEPKSDQGVTETRVDRADNDDHSALVDGDKTAQEPIPEAARAEAV